MALTVNTGPSSTDAEVVGVPFFEGGVAAIGGLAVPDAAARARRGFEGKVGQVGSYEVDGRTVVALGLGNANEVTLDSLRRAAASFVRSASSVESAALALAAVEVDGADAASKAQAIAEGVVLGFYRYGEFKSKEDDRKLRDVILLGADAAGVERGRWIAEATSKARDLVNSPPIAMTPTRFAEIATEVANECGLGITVWDEKKILEERLGAVLGVAAGSAEPPRFIQLSYEPEGAAATLALVGKGITFDSGGLSLKTAEGMITMKGDMTGAANVLMAMSVLPKLAPNVRVLGFLPLTENMPGPKATKPSDVLRARNGTTIEVLNTDAEGRLVLSDALVLAVEAQPDAIIDIATLTGAIVVALGDEISGLMGTNDALIEQVKAASERTSEPLWHMPLPARYRKKLDSPIADLKNIGPRGVAGSLTAGLFLKEFTGGLPWVHLDIAGTEHSDSDDGYISKGGTAFGTRTLIEVVEKFTKP